jgi:ubiquinone biosynthesis protein
VGIGRRRAAGCDVFQAGTGPVDAGRHLPARYQAELARLQDAAPAEPVAAVRAVVEAELGRAVEDAFSSFDPEPLASASIGQARAAVTTAGDDVG